MKIPNFFCGGPPKSGTTFLQRILDSHPEIGCSSEDDLQKLLNSFIELHRSYNHKLLVVGQRIGAKNVPQVESKVFENLFFKLISDISSNRNQGKKIIGISDNDFLLNNLIQTLKFYIHSKVIIIFRNPIDTALSAWDSNHRLYKKENHPAHLNVMKVDGKLDIDKYVIEMTKSWNNTVQNVLKKIKTAPERNLVITYESLVLNKKDVLVKILKFIDCKYNDEILLDMINNSSIDKMRDSSSRPEFFSKGRVSFGKNELKTKTIKSAIKISKDNLNILNIKFN
jgi:hypothetical protein